MKEFKMLLDGKDIRHHVYADDAQAAVDRFVMNEYVAKNRVKAIEVRLDASEYYYENV
jgi:hypothetical protein